MRSRARVFHPQTIEGVDRGGGIRTKYFVARSDKPRQLLSGLTELDPGASVPFHSHNCEETVIVLLGDAVFDSSARRETLTVGDATWTPAGVIHRYTNAGTGALLIYWTYGSVEATRTIQETGDTFPILGQHP